MAPIWVEGLRKDFGGRTAVEALSFEVGEGEVFGLLGPNGAGKTTTVRMLTGLLAPTSGQAKVCGLELGAGEALRRTVGLLTEQPGLYDRLTLRENLSFFIRLNEMDLRAGWARADHYLERFGLAGREDELCGTLSKGMRQKLAIIRALVHEPKVVFLDEPTSGLDPESARTVRDSVAQLADEGATIVLCSHNLPEVERLCSRVAIIRNRLLALSSVRELRRTGALLTVRLENDASAFRQLVAELPFHPAVFAEGSSLRVHLDEAGHAPEVIGALVAAGARVHAALPAERTLEEVYLELVREERS